MGAADLEFDDVLALREVALIGAATQPAPWGPALGEAISESDVVASQRRPAAVMVGAAVGGSGDTWVGGPEPSFGAWDEETSLLSPVTPASWLDAPAEELPPMDTVESGRTDASTDLADATRQQLTRLYDPRLAAPVLLEVDGSGSAGRTERVDPVERNRRPVRGDGDRGRDRELSALAAKRKFRRRAVVGVLLAAVAIFATRSVRHALDGEQDALVRNVATPVGQLPWHGERYGNVVVEVPTAGHSVAVDAASGFLRFDRYVLPDVTLIVAARPSSNDLSNDVALRGYAGQLAQQFGGAVSSGFARDLTFGTSFSASVQLSEGKAYLFVLSTPDQVLEVRAEFVDDSSGRPTRIYEQVIRSITPA